MKMTAAVIASLLVASSAHAERCTASIYDRSSGSETASGERLNESALTAAHKTLPLGSHVRVCNQSNGRCVTVRISDRGPFIRRQVHLGFYNNPKNAHQAYVRAAHQYFGEFARAA